MTFTLKKEVKEELSMNYKKKTTNLLFFMSNNSQKNGYFRDKTLFRV